MTEKIQTEEVNLEKRSDAHPSGRKETNKRTRDAEENRRNIRQKTVFNCGETVHRQCNHANKDIPHSPMGDYKPVNEWIKQAHCFVQRCKGAWSKQWKNYTIWDSQKKVWRCNQFVLSSRYTPTEKHVTPSLCSDCMYQMCRKKMKIQEENNNNVIQLRKDVQTILQLVGDNKKLASRRIGTGRVFQPYR